MSITFNKAPKGDPNFDNVSLLLHMDGTNGSTTFTDSSKNNFTATRFGNAQISTTISKFGDGAGYFDGNGDYLTLSSQNAFGFGTGDFTIELWYYALAPASSNGAVLLDLRQTSIYDGVTFLVFDINGLQTLVLYDGSAGVPNLRTGIQSSDPVPIGQWTHLVAQRRGISWSLYIDGILQTNPYSSSGNFGTSRPCTIASQGAPFGVSRFLNGYIDDLRITKGVARYTGNFTPPTEPFPNISGITAKFKFLKGGNKKINFLKLPPLFLTQDLVAFWKLDNTIDSSANGNTLTNNGSVQFVVGKVGNCAQFIGSNSVYLQDGSLSSPFNPNGPAGEFTISCWVNPASFSNYQAFLGSTAQGFIIHLDNAGNLYCNEATSGDAQINSILQLNQWQHIVFVKSVASGNRTKVWYNGTKVYDGPTQNVNNYQSKTNITLGNYGNLDFPYDGKLDMVGLWNKELTETEIATLYNNGAGLEP